MSDQTQTPGSGDNPTPENNGTGQAPNAPENNSGNQLSNPEKKPDDKPGNVEVPKDKWDQTYARMKSAEEKLKEYEEAEKKRAEEKALEEGKYNDVIGNLKNENAELLKRASSLESMEGTLQKYLNAEMAKVDESKRSLIPENFSTREKLDYIVANQSFLYSEAAKANNATPPIPKSEQEMALNELEAAKNKVNEFKARVKNGEHLSEPEQTELSRLVRMITAASE